MLNWFRNILYKWQSVDDANATDTHRMPIVTDLDTMLGLVAAIKDSKRTLTTQERLRLKVNSSASSFGLLLIELRLIASAVTSTDRHQKYYETYPEWMRATSRKWCLDEWLVDENEMYQDLDILVRELECVLNQILLHLNADYNRDFTEYYITKPKRVYQSINFALDSLINVL